LQIDIGKALEATELMSNYLTSIDEDWPGEDNASVEIFHTMQANADGWEEAMAALQMKANGLGVVLVQLETILNEMAKRAGVASRKSIVSVSTYLGNSWDLRV